MQQDNAERKYRNRVREDRILFIAIGVPIVAALLIGAGPAIWQGITSIVKVIAPNVWTVLVYIYIAVLAFLIGRRTKK